MNYQMHFSFLRRYSALMSRALIAGIANSVIGYTVIFTLMNYAVAPILSNVLGYIVGLVASFMLNKFWVMENKERDYWQIIRFGFAFFISYFSSLCMLYVLVYLLDTNAYIAQILSGGVYFIFFLVINKLYVFKRRS